MLINLKEAATKQLDFISINIGMESKTFKETHFILGRFIYV